MNQFKKSGSGFLLSKINKFNKLKNETAYNKNYEKIAHMEFEIESQREIILKLNSDLNKKTKELKELISINQIKKNKFEFYIQPQFVNQGTATPSHYQVMCAYQHTDEILKLEQLEKLTFYLCYYYFTWAGAIREPGTLKMAETALDFSVRCFVDKNDPNAANYFYQTPIYL